MLVEHITGCTQPLPLVSQHAEAQKQAGTVHKAEQHE